MLHKNSSNIVLGTFSNLLGMESGAQQAGFITPFSTDISDISENVFKVQRRNQTIREVFLKKDIRTLSFADIISSLLSVGIDLEKEDIACLVGGPPCFGLSLQSTTSRSVFHPLNFLMLEWLRMVRELRPMTAWMEQVPTLLSDSVAPFRRLLFTHLNSLEGYSWEIGIQNAQDFGCFQSRKRTTLILVRDDLKVSPSLPKGRPVDLASQSAFATIGAEKFRSMQFSHKPVNGYEKVFGTLTSSDYEIYQKGRWRKLSLEQRKILAHMTNINLSGVSDTDLKKMLGMMVLPPFAYEVMMHIRTILERSGKVIF